MREAIITRNTKETTINMELNLDEDAPRRIETSLPFLTHMLETLSCHGGWSLKVEAQGDIEVDPHHLMEDCGIVLGRTLAQALKDAGPIQRAGFSLFPMDRSLAQVALDLCGRPNLVWNVPFEMRSIGTLDPGLFYDFFKGFAGNAGATVHVNVPYSDNDHHAIEAVFKAFARAATQATTPIEGDGPLSTKGVLND